MTITEFLNEFTFIELTEDVLAECEHFSCGVGDLDEYFQKDVLGYTRSDHRSSALNAFHSRMWN